MKINFSFRFSSAVKSLLRRSAKRTNLENEKKARENNKSREI
jgi:hypothetical protein